jgi:hypothetical protein
VVLVFIDLTHIFPFANIITKAATQNPCPPVVPLPTTTTTTTKRVRVEKTMFFGVCGLSLFVCGVLVFLCGMASEWKGG